MTFTLRAIDADNPVVQEAAARYLAKWNIRDPGPQPPKYWWGLFEGQALALVFAYLKRDDGGIELTDVYIEPSKRGIAAVKYAGETLKMALGQGVIPYCMASTFARNKRALRWAAEYLGKLQPDVAGFVFPGASLDSQRRAILEGSS